MSNAPIAITERVKPPLPSEILQLRLALGLTQTQAANIVSTREDSAYKTWRSWELPQSHPQHRRIPLSTWELFLLMTGSHPTLKLIRRR